MRRRNVEIGNSLKKEAERLRTVEIETMETIETIDILSKNINEKYDDCIERLEYSEMQTKNLYDRSKTYDIIKNDLNKVIKKITNLQSTVEITSQAIDINSVKTILLENDTVDLIREYSKQFVFRPMNEKFEKIEFYFNEKVEKMEKHFILRIKEMENLIENNNQKTGELDKVIETLQLNQNKFEGKSELLQEINKKKFEEIELRFNDIKQNNDLTEIEKKFQQLTELIKQSEIQIKQLSENTEVDFTKKLDKTNELIICFVSFALLYSIYLKVETTSMEIEIIKSDEIGQLQKIESETKQTIDTLSKDIKEKYDNCMKLHDQLQLELRNKDEETRRSLKEEAKKLEKVEDETKQTIEMFSKKIKEKYDKCIDGLFHNELQLTTFFKENKNNERILKNVLNKTIEDIAELQLKVKTTSKAIEELKSDEIKPLEKIGYGITQIIVCFISFALFYSLSLKVKISSKAIEEIKSDKIGQLKKVETETEQTIAQLQSKVETTSKAIEKIKSDEIGQLKTDVNGIEELVKQINSNKELDQVIKLAIKILEFIKSAIKQI
ncbi:hypothetical protein CHUAL_000108 [Chamberlinius hualienensis]